MAIVKLKDILTNKPIYGSYQNQFEFGKYKFLTQADLKLNSPRKYVNNVDGSLLSKGDLLLSRVGTAGVAYFHDSNENWVYSGNFTKYLINPKFAITKYIYYVFLSKEKEFKIISKKGTTIPNLSPNTVCESKINLPDLKMQRKIISIIEPFEKLKEQILLKKDKLIKIFIGLYNEFKGQSLTNLNSFIKISNKKYNNQSFYVDTGNIGYCNFVDYEKIEIKKSRADLSAISNSILFSKLNGINKILPIYNPFFNNFVYSTGFYNVTSNNNAYLLGFLLSNEFLNQKNNLAQGTTMKGINNSVLTKIKMNVIDLRYESFHFDFAITLLSNYIVVAYKLDLIIRNLAKFLIK